MRVDVDLDLGVVVSGPGTKEPLSEMRFKRDTAATLELHFWKNNTRVDLDAGAVGAFGIKPLGKFDGDPLVFESAWEKFGTGADASYVFEPDLSSDLLADLFFSGDDNANNDVATILAHGEIRWIVDGKKNRTRTFNVVLENDILKDSDMDPFVGSPPIGNTAPTNDSALGVAANGSIMLYPDLVEDGDWVALNWPTNAEGSSYSNVTLTFRDAPSSSDDVAIGDNSSATLALNLVNMFASVVSDPMAPILSTTSTPGEIVINSSYEGILSNYIGLDAGFNETGAGFVSGPYLTGGVDFETPTLAPPYIRVADGFLYIQEAGIWKKTALSAL